MRRAPHRPGETLWAGGLGRRTIWIGIFIGAVSLGIGFWYKETDQVEWQTMMFTTLAFMQVAQALRHPLAHRVASIDRTAGRTR
jgi:P-type Ca2+ transporter type 2C